jgi:hypothetical protein
VRINGLLVTLQELLKYEFIALYGPNLYENKERKYISL